MPIGLWRLLGHALVLCSLNPITKKTPTVARRLGRTSPDPGLGPRIELSRRHAPRLLDLAGIGKALSSQSIPPEKSPPALLQIQPACAFGNEHLMDARMLGQPSVGFCTQVTGQVIGNHENVARRVVGLDVAEQSNIPFGVARGRASGQFLAIAYAQCSIEPGLLKPSTILQRCLDAVPIRRPPWRWGKGTRDYWSQFISTDGRRPLWRSRVVGDDRYSFGTKSLSVLVPQLWVRRQRTPSRKQMRRI